MKTFEKAQKCFSKYQRNGTFHQLRESLDILEEMIESQRTDCYRAINFKQIIEEYLDTQINNIRAKSDIDEFGKSLKDDELGNLLYESLSKDDLGILIRLLKVKKEYFKL